MKKSAGLWLKSGGCYLRMDPRVELTTLALLWLVWEKIHQVVNGEGEGDRMVAQSSTIVPRSLLKIGQMRVDEAGLDRHVWAVKRELMLVSSVFCQHRPFGKWPPGSVWGCAPCSSTFSNLFIRLSSPFTSLCLSPSPSFSLLEFALVSPDELFLSKKPLKLMVAHVTMVVIVRWRWLQEENGNEHAIRSTRRENEEWFECERGSPPAYKPLTGN